ncbi:tail fiber domain-containing protein [Methylocella silvestris]|uniref:tail fiber domain-containing protein n=1 Tax=Methylocella silvestris TaxID=199596 RepID=UPI0001726373|nr:tail fiber domain-containing protein [Methylocella silvestris]
MSERQEKCDVEQIGVLANGLPLYRFRYVGDPELHLGLMAEDVVGVVPEAVTIGPDGLMQLDYERALENAALWASATEAPQSRQ